MNPIPTLIPKPSPDLIVNPDIMKVGSTGGKPTVIFVFPDGTEYRIVLEPNVPVLPIEIASCARDWLSFHLDAVRKMDKKGGKP
jgi:hypothetical protein